MDWLALFGPTRQTDSNEKVYKFFWGGNCYGKGKDGAGILLGEKWIDMVFDVGRVTDRMIIRMVLGRVVFTFLSVYAPIRTTEADDDSFYDQLQRLVAKSQAQRPSFPICVWDTHVGGAGCGFEVKSGRGFGVWKTGTES